MAARTSKHGGARPNAGRKPKREEERLTAIFDAAVSNEDWTAAVKSVMSQAKRGNVQALKELLDRRFGKVVDKQEVSGKDGSALEIVLREISHKADAND